MWDFFYANMEVGRYREKTVIFVFSQDRPYFDQILHKNMLFRKRYAKAYDQWLQNIKSKNGINASNLRERILLGIAFTGEERVKKLFASLLRFLRSQGLSLLPPEVFFADTFPGGKYEAEKKYEAVILPIRLFWSRLAIPVVKEDEF